MTGRPALLATWALIAIAILFIALAADTSGSPIGWDIIGGGANFFVFACSVMQWQRRHAPIAIAAATFVLVMSWSIGSDGLSSTTPVYLLIASASAASTWRLLKRPATKRDTSTPISNSASR